MPALDVFCPECARAHSYADVDPPVVNCITCGKRLSVVGRVQPAKFTDPPYRMFAARTPAPERSSIRIATEGDTLRIRAKIGLLSFVSKTVTITKDELRIRTILGRSHVEPVEAVHGICVFQDIVWTAGLPSVQYSTHLWTRTYMLLLFLFDDLANAYHLASVMNEQLAHARQANAPYRN
jgi:hypothetical protein